MTEELTELEQKYLDARKLFKEEIKKHLEDASNALSEAEKLSEQYGVPFHSYISFLGQEYTPMSMEKIWGKDYQETLKEVDSFQDYSGWEHSAVC